MSKFASGKFSSAVCDRCGFPVPYNSIKAEWTGLRVCEDCFDPKHPQLEPTKKDLSDPKPLRHARPLTHTEEIDPAELLENIKPSTAGQGRPS